MPVALLDRLRPDNVFVDAPLAGAPLNNLVGGAGKVAGNERLISVLVQIAAGQTAALRENVGVVGGGIVRARLKRRTPNLGGAVAFAGQRAARRERGEMSAIRRRRRTVAAVASAAAAAKADGSEANKDESRAA